MNGYFRLAATACFTGLLATATPARAFTQLIAFGDSLSDTGAVYAATFGLFPTADYYNHRFSNGPIAVDYLAQSLGNIPLTSYAVGGATTGTANRIGSQFGLPGLGGVKQEIDTYVSGGAADANALYLVWAGANDIYNWMDNPAGTTATQLVDGMVGNIGYAVDQLEGLGARNILVPNLPDIDGLGTDFSIALSTMLDNHRATPGFDATLYDADVLSTNNAIFSNPASYGFSDLLDPCATVTVVGFSISVSTCSSDPAVQNTHLFWDNLGHPTTPWHAAMAGVMARAVPEPEAWALLLVGIALVGVRARRRLRFDAAPQRPRS